MTVRCSTTVAVALSAGVRPGLGEAMSEVTRQDGEGVDEPSPGARGSPSSLQSSHITPADAATRLFIEDLRRRVEAASEETKQDGRTLRKRESAIFLASIVSGVVAIGLIVSGFVLMVISQLAFAVVSECVGLLSGGGTAIFRQLARETGRRREALSAKESEEA